jgi:uncharacterized membrane protein YraQ (UPF0718 family)
MILAAAIIWPAVLVSVWLLWRGPPARAARALEAARHNALFMGLRLPFAMMGAGFVATLLPERLVGEFLGGESGWSGILLASLVGGLVPSGPMISFPLTLALAKMGVGVPQLVAFLTAWSVLSVHRLITWELPLLELRFNVARYAASLVLPPLSGALAALLIGSV